jgi:hypothetical protein
MHQGISPVRLFYLAKDAAPKAKLVHSTHPPPEGQSEGRLGIYRVYR